MRDLLLAQLLLTPRVDNSSVPSGWGSKDWLQLQTGRSKFTLIPENIELPAIGRRLLWVGFVWSFFNRTVAKGTCGAGKGPPRPYCRLGLGKGSEDFLSNPKS